MHPHRHGPRDPGFVPGRRLPRACRVSRFTWCGWAGLAAGCALAGCGPREPAPGGVAQFEHLDTARTGIAFRNTLPEAADFNIINYLYYYNGGGVAVGDVDGDGWQDLYFSANLGANRLYRNVGDYRFEDITERAGVAGPPGWKTGVTMADVNGDGHVDIYVSAVRYLGQQGRNALYVNRGDGTFADSTEAFGLGQSAYGTQALFLDHDRDGDLDAYLLNHSTHVERGITSIARTFASSPGADRLMRNDGTRFTDVSREAGIVDGAGGGAFGLGVVASDLDGNGCPDLYVGNDFQENDYLFVNNCDGTFTERVTEAMRHTSRFSMGVDAGDVDNDGRPDLITVDMLPDREAILKSSAGIESANLFDLRLRAGYQAQYPRNTLQLNRGGLRFSDIALLAGVSATDWSWAPLLADLDNDGWKDLFVTTGIYRRPNDLDYISYIGNEAVQAALARGEAAEAQALLRRMPQVPLPNRVFRNRGDLTFEDRTDAWGLGAHPGFTNGAAYVDLTNSGRLDLVVNAINAPAAIYRNRGPAGAGLTLWLHGEGRNTAGFGARVEVVANGMTQVFEQAPTRGFQSSVDPRLHVGLGSARVADTVRVSWLDGRRSTLTEVAPGGVVRIGQDSASPPPGPASPPPRARAPWPDLAGTLGAAFSHVENDFRDENREPLLWARVSTEGPALAVADANGDGRDDIFVGGGKWQPGRVLMQRGDGTFASLPQPALVADSLAEDVDAVWVDADADGDLDLVVVPGGNEFEGDSEALLPRLYLNDGRGELRRDTLALPRLPGQWGCVAAGDADGDGDRDLFLGGRVVARAWGRMPRSALLRNDGRGRFTDVSREMHPALGEVGMVTSCAWGDLDGDGRDDLVVAGDWMRVRVFMGRGATLAEATDAAGLRGSSGWWRSVLLADLDGDGDRDLVLGNQGRNTWVRADSGRPATAWVGAFAGTGGLQQILAFYKGDVSYPLSGRDDLVKLIPALRPRYPTYASFGAATVEEIFPPDQRARATRLEAEAFASVVARNDGRGHFSLEPLPVAAQFAPVHASVATDVDGNGRPELIVAGNFTANIPALGANAASYGLVLGSDPRAGWVARDPGVSGLLIDGDVRRLAVVRHARGGQLLAVARNGRSLQLLAMPAVPAAADRPAAVPGAASTSPRHPPP